MIEWRTEIQLYIIKQRNGLSVSFFLDFLQHSLTRPRSQGKSKRINLNSPLTRIPTLLLCLYRKGYREFGLVTLSMSIWRHKNCSYLERAE